MVFSALLLCNEQMRTVCMYAYIQHVAVDMQSIMVKSHWLVNCSVNIFFTVNHNTVILSGIFFQQEFFQQKKEYPLFVDGTICIRPISNTDSSIF